MKTYVCPFDGKEYSEESLEDLPKGMCPKCMGKGILEGPLPNNGVCYACSGKGRITGSDLARAYRHPQCDEFGWFDRVSGIDE